jgi:hypothetical protein
MPVQEKSKIQTAKTKVVGVALVLVSVLQILIDALDGNGFNLSSNLDNLQFALGGAGFWALRDALSKGKGLFGK